MVSAAGRGEVIAKPRTLAASATIPLPVILALDLEGTLISNAVSQIPRPGLYDFLEFCRSRFERVVLFTAVREARARHVAESLAEEGLAPDWFAAVEIVRWSGTIKDLTLIDGVADVREACLVDDQRVYVRDDQLACWVPIVEFCAPYSEADDELVNVRNELEARLRGFIDATRFLGQLVTLEIDRPVGSAHPDYGWTYPVNYGQLPGTIAPDGEPIDAYLLEVSQPCDRFTGRCIAVIRRRDDADDKLVVVPDGMEITDEEILDQTSFQEKWFDSHVIRRAGR